VYDVYRARLRGQVERKASIFRTSVKDDERIFEIDIDGTEAHEIMLYEEHVLTREELKKILSALEKLRIEKRDGRIELDLRYEDIHELIEGYVINEVGLEIGGKIHTGRSRNDQVALDIRMSLRSDLNETSDLLLSLINTILEKAEEYLKRLKFTQVRVRDHYPIARIEINSQEFKKLLAVRKKISHYLRKLGYKHITVDLNGYQTGSLNS